ncbi:MAG: TonB-dependent receptor [Acidobacteria bacterium]|nr:TonB-dependent receptor [Acidobacteriota bacterium]
MLPSPLRTSLAAVLVLGQLLPAAELSGTIRFGGLPLPGATITISKGSTKHAAISDTQGRYAFTDIAEGQWKAYVQMQLFQDAHQDITVPGTPVEWDLNLLPEDRLQTLVTDAPKAGPAAVAVKGKSPPKAATNTKGEFQRADLKGSGTAATAPSDAAPPPQELAQRAADGLLINGSVNNGAASPFAQFPAFGNNRRGQRPLYNGNLGLVLNNSAFDARSYSLTGQDTPKPGYSRMQGLFAFGGPIKIPHWIDRGGPNFTINYQWTRQRNAITQSALMPSAAERTGDLSASRAIALDPTTGSPFLSNIIPTSRISPQALGLLPLFPEPNFTGSSRYNYQVPIVSGLHQDDLQTRINKQRRRNFLNGNFSFQSTRTDTPNLFQFLDTGRVFGLIAGVGYRRSFSPRSYINTSYSYSRFSSTTTPYFANRANISAGAGITGNNQDPLNWGPPALQFSSGLATLGDAQHARNHNQTSSISIDGFMNRDRHNLQMGVTHRRQQFNVVSQQDPRGTFTFTGATTGSDLAGFLLGVPDTASIAFGNADKYLRGSITESFINDDWRVNPGFTVNAGLRWEYWSPLHEKYGRLVNLQFPSGFSTATPNVGATLEPDRNNISPRIGISYRPMAADSLVIRAGYGVYYDTSVYQPIAMQMSQQPPLSRNLRIANSAAVPLTLANGFLGSGIATLPTYSAASHLKIGYSQTWLITVQRDLPGGLQWSGNYTGTKGTRAQQQFLPNTFPAGAINPCPTCPSGFTYLASDGNSTRHSGQFQLRRRLRSGFTAQGQYTWAHSIDNAALGARGSVIAQDWLNLSGERGRSNFDQRHLLTASMQYTTGMGMRGGALTGGWRGRLLKEWTFGSQLTRGSGLPLTPIFFTPVRGTGVVGSVRPDYTGASIYDAPAGLFLNPAAVTAPAAGRWGNAGRNSITGPSQFLFNANLGRTFRSTDRVSVDFRLDAANILNTVTFPYWNTVAGNAQFGLPTTANAMRTIQAVLRMRF